MRGFVRLLCAEWWKMRHCGIYLLHILLPLLAGCAFLLYDAVSAWNVYEQSSMYAQVLGIAFPVVVSIVCGRNVELEEKEHFQTLLGGCSGRCQVFVAKWVALLGCAAVSVLTAFVILAGGEHFLFHNTDVPIRGYLLTGMMFWGGGILLYLEHLFLNLACSRTISMGISVVQALLCALLLTGLGDQRWQWFPCSWSARSSAVVLGITEGESQGMPGRCLLPALILCVIIMLWFRLYEGRACHD